MKNSYFAKLQCFLLAILSLSFTSALAQLDQGKVYRFVNVQYPTYSLCASSTTTAGAGTTLENSKTQLWYVDTRTDGSNTTYRLRNLRTGKYLQGNGNTQWKLVDETAGTTYLYLQEAPAGAGTYTLSTNNSTGGVNKMHCDGSYNIVGWYSDSQGTQWKITQVTTVNGETINEDWLAANWNEVSNFPPSDEVKANYQTALDNIFSDKACTTLNASYSSMTEGNLETDANYSALPSALRLMVKKIWNESRTSVEEAWKEAHVSGDADKEWRGDYAKRFRVQLYEPYTERECTNAALRINIHTNLNNPTGIFGNDGDLLYVMVDQEVPAGASLYLGSYEGHGQAGNYNDGVQLHQGLNIIPYWKEKMWTCIYYTVPTLKAWDGTTNKTQYDLTQFPDLKIHIEGGYINGYFNAVGDDLWAHDAATTGCDGENNVSTIKTTLEKANGGTTTPNDNMLQSNCVYPKGDNEADWDYYAARNVMPDLTILGKSMVFQFYFESPESDHPEYSTSYWFNKNEDGTRRIRISEWLERWDRVMMSERLTMGLLSKEEIEEANARYHAQDESKHDIYTYTGEDEDLAFDYSKHYRMHGLAISNNSGYMSGGWTSSNYHYNTLAGIIGDMMNMESSGGATWGPGHEIGHQHQGPFNMRGLTEVTNNLYSNIAVWYDGRGTSRVNGGEGDLTEVLKAYNQTPHDFFTNNIWAQTHMYYKLWLYYHLVGKNTKFYPRLMELLRRDPMTIQYDQAGSTSLLHFYKKVCDAAQEDLTEFFRAYGFFEVMDHRYVGDYSSAEYTQTQEDIDAAIAYVKGKNYSENTNVLFINDYTAGVSYKNHEGGDRKLWDGKTYSDLGSYTVFDGTESSTITGSYDLSVSNGQSTISNGDGGIGFLIYDENGKLLAFSSDKTFPVNDETEMAIAKGNVKIESIPVEGEPQEVTYDPSTASVSLLKGMLETVAAELEKNNEDGGESGDAYTHAGYYKSNRDAYQTLVEKYEAAKTVYQEGDVTKYVETYTALNSAYEALMADQFATVPLVVGNKYYIRSVGSGNSYLYSKATEDSTPNSLQKGSELPEDKSAYMWTLEPATEEGKYYLKNCADEDKYIQTDLKNDAANNEDLFTVGANKYAFTVSVNDAGKFNIYTESLKKYLNASGKSSNVIAWNDANDNNCKWTFTVAEEDVLAAGISRLQNMAEQTKELMNQMATVKIKGKQDMSQLRISSNATEQNHGTEMLVDNNLNTYFHTNWQGNNPVDEYHYILIDCGSIDDAIDQFTLNWNTLPITEWNVDAPKEIKVQVTNTDVDAVPTDFIDLVTLTTDADGNPLPTAKGQSCTTGSIGTAGTPYRYIRLQVTKTTGSNWGNYPYFGLAELGITLMNSKVYSIKDEYTDASLGELALTSEKVHDIANAIGDALNSTFTSSDDVDALYTQMKAYYEALSNTFNTVANADLNAAREELQALVDKSQKLIDACGTVEMFAPSIPLQSTDANASGYLYCNAPYLVSGSDYSPQGLDGYHLLDGDINTFLHTDYSNTAPTENHYLRVYMGTEGLGQFSFTYTNRNQADAWQANPCTIVVEGSNEEDGTYTEIATVTNNSLNPMPKNSESSYGATYNSLVLGSNNKKYAYIRFRVTKTYGNTRYFYLSEFGLKEPSRYEATLITDNAEVTEDLLIATEKARSSAATAIAMATDAEKLTAAQAELQKAYDALFEASKSGLNAAISAVEKLYQSCFTDETATEIKSEYSNSVNVTANLLNEVKQAIDEARSICNEEELTLEKLSDCMSKMNDTKSRLQTAIDYADIPVTLTVDTENPVYYSIVTMRDGDLVFQSRSASEGEENKIKLTAYEAGNDRQMWYFVKGTETPKVRIVNKTIPNLVVACIPSDFAVGAGKIQSLALDAACGTNEWVLSNENSMAGCYNITADKAGTTFYMSNYGGVGNNMGFYNSNPNTDTGSNFKFRRLHSEAYEHLCEYFVNDAKLDLSAYDNVFPEDWIDDTAIAYYPANEASKYETAYSEAANLLNQESDVADNIYAEAYNKLVAANEALAANAPEEGAYYALRSAATVPPSPSGINCLGKLAYAEVESACRMLYDKDNQLQSTDARALWQFIDNGDGTFKMKNLHTGMYATKGTPFHVQESGQNVVFKPLGEGQTSIWVDGTRMSCYTNWGTIRDTGDAVAKNSRSAWLFEKVEDIESVCQSVNITAYEYAGFYSAYPVTIPNGLRAYYVSEGDATKQVGDDKGKAMLTKITGIIPAHTGVILYGGEGSYEMHYASETVPEISNNMLKGSPVVSYKQGDEGANYYLFGVKNAEVGLYQAWLQYSQNGTIADGNANTDNGGYFKVSANKIYMPFTPTTQQVAAFYFDFKLTDIEGVNTEIPADATIYDIQGRRINRIHQSGLYIINGEKRMVSKQSIK